MNAKVLSMLVLAGILVGTSAAVSADNEYVISPAERIICTVRAQNPDGSREAIGTDFTNNREVFLEIILIYTGGSAGHTWTIDRSTSAVSTGGYNVFRKHCAPIMEQLPEEFKKELKEFFD